MELEVDEAYSSRAVGVSQGQLEAVTELVEPPACLLGGWAVHLWVNERYEQEKGRGYVGSRDIDIGFPVDSEGSADDLKDGSVGTTFEAFRQDGFSPARFGFQKFFSSTDGEKLTEEEAQKLPLHEVVEMRVDTLPDAPGSEAFQEAFGFQPPAEPLLTHAFSGAGKPLDGFVEWDLPQGFLIVDHSLLAAMKLRSFPDRGKHHKIVKDLADLYAVIWYVSEWRQNIDDMRGFVEEGDTDSFEQELDDSLVEEAADLLGEEPGDVMGVFDEIMG